MNTSQILKGAELLRENAAKIATGSLKVDGLTYSFQFDGRNWVCTQGENHIANYNTRSIAQARKWLREYLAN